MTQFHLRRRGFDLGEITIEQKQNDPLENWSKGLAIQLSGFCNAQVAAQQQQIQDTEQLVHGVWEEQSIEKLLSTSPYQERLDKQFSILGSGISERDQQEIETVFFDGLVNQKVSAQDLWMKTSWLSFHDEDASLRFRFSFGVDLEEDVAADPHRQKFAARLCDQVFPESAVINKHKELEALLSKLIDREQIHYVERIIYFNAPGGGAYLHHDLERGHAGVAYAQLSGQTFWLALPLEQLVQSIIDYAAKHKVSDNINALCTDADKLVVELNSFANDDLISLINETPEFVLFLHRAGYSRLMQAGDILLLPQTTAEQCCWHSVFCVGDEVGQALSFAIR